MNDNGNQIYDGPGELAAALDDFDVITYYFIHIRIIRNPLKNHTTQKKFSSNSYLDDMIPRPHSLSPFYKCVK